MDAIARIRIKGLRDEIRRLRREKEGYRNKIKELYEIYEYADNAVQRMSEDMRQIGYISDKWRSVGFGVDRDYFLGEGE